MMKNRFGKGRHRKFQDDWERAREPVLEGVTFYAKYLGMCLVSLPNDETHTAEAVRRIVHNAKYSSKLLFKKVSLTVTPKAIIQTNLERPEDVLEVSIHRISYCAADKTNDNKVFAYIANNSITEALECHAYLCSKRKIAEALTLTVAQAFNIAFELWEQEKEDEDNGLDDSKDPAPAETSSPFQKSAPQTIPSSSKSTSSNNEADKGCWSSSTSPPLPPSLDPPPSSTRKVLTVQAEIEPISASAPCTVPVVPQRRPMGKPRFSPAMVNGNSLHDSGVDSSVDSKEMEATAKLLEKWHIGDDSDLDESFSRLAECRSNPQLLDINVRRTQFDADIIVHFQGNQTERNQLLESRSTDNFQLEL